MFALSFYVIYSSDEKPKNNNVTNVDDAIVVRNQLMLYVLCSICVLVCSCS